jgi:hypothetical protein
MARGLGAVRFVQRRKVLIGHRDTDCGDILFEMGSRLGNKSSVADSGISSQSAEVRR